MAERGKHWHIRVTDTGANDSFSMPAETPRETIVQLLRLIAARSLIPAEIVDRFRAHPDFSQAEGLKVDAWDSGQTLRCGNGSPDVTALLEDIPDPAIAAAKAQKIADAYYSERIGALWETLRGSLWHATPMHRFRRILESGEIQPRPQEGHLWAQVGPTCCRSIEAVSLFDLAADWAAVWKTSCSKDEWLKWLRHEPRSGISWEPQVWIEIDRNLPTLMSLRDTRAEADRNPGRQWIPELEACHPGPIPLSACPRTVVVYDILGTRPLFDVMSLRSPFDLSPIEDRWAALEQEHKAQQETIPSDGPNLAKVLADMDARRASADKREAIANEIRRQLSPWRKFTVAIDGRDNAGKSTLARYLAWQLGMPTIELDLLMPRAPDVDLDLLRRLIEARHRRDRPVIVEGIFVLQRLAEIGVTPDYVVYVEAEGGTEGSLSWAELFERYEQRFNPGAAHYRYTRPADS